MKEKYHELADGDLTYILAPAFIQPHEAPKFGVAGFFLSGQTTVFALKSNLKDYKGAAVESAEAFVSKQLLSEMNRQLDEYAGNNPDILAGIWQEHPDQLPVLLNLAGREIPFQLQFWLQWSRLDEGLVRVSLRQEAIQFDLNTQQFSMEDGSPLSSPLYELLEPVGYWRQVAAKQRELGIQNAGYAELAKINNFLNGRNSVHVLLRDNREFTLRAGGTLTAGDLFRRDYHSEMLVLKDNGTISPRHDEDIPIEEVVSLLHGKKYLDVDVTAIRELFGELPDQTQLQGSPAMGQEM